MRPEGGQPEIYATGLRNVVDLGWHPTTGELYATEVGRDFMGDDLPPDELNRIERGAFYGFPFLHGDGIPDPDLAPPDAASISEARSPAYAFPAHSTPLGLTFLASGEALVALHGSWNRSQKVGYEIVALRWDRDGIAVSAFASGFERDEDVVGRPVDVIEGPDGAIYVSDDYAGAIYRIARVAPAHALRPGETGRVDYRSRHRSP
jgi:glucose/arabinose dehydrogenase